MLGPGRVEVREFELPSVSEDTLLVRMEASGVCGSDIRVYSGLRFGPEHPTDFPFIPGHENVGIVEEVGEQAARSLETRGERLTRGDRIVWYPVIPCNRCLYCNFAPESRQLCQHPWIYGWVNCNRRENSPWIFGGYGEHVLVRPGTYVWKVDRNLPVERYAILDTLVSVRAVGELGPYYGQRVLILGDGPVGMCAAAKAKALGAEKVFMVGRHKNRLDSSYRFGVDETLDLNMEFKQLRVQVEKMTDGLGADVCVDCSGRPEGFVQAVRLTRRGGSVIEIGCILDSGEATINPALDMVTRNIRIIGQYYAPPQQYEKDLRFLLGGRFPLHELVTHRFGLEQAEEAIRSHLNRDCLKAIIVPSL